MNIDCNYNGVDFNIRITKSYVKGFNIDIVEDRDIKCELLKLTDILSMSRGEGLTFVVNGNCVDINFDTVDAFINSAVYTNEFFNRTIYQILSFIIKGHEEHLCDIFTHPRFKRSNWKDYSDDEIIEIDDSANIYDTLCKLNLKLGTLVRYGHIHAISVYKSGYDIRNYDIESVLTKFTINEEVYMCHGAHFDESTMYVCNLDKMIPLHNNDSIHLNIPHYNVDGVYKVISIDYDVYSRSYIIKLEEMKNEDN